MSSDSLFRPAALSLLAGFVLIALLVDALRPFRLACVVELDPVRMLRAEVSFAISALISFTILAVSTESALPKVIFSSLAYSFIGEGAGKRGAGTPRSA